MDRSAVVARRDVGALASPFGATTAELVRLARHLCRDAEEAEDLAQATLLALPERFE